MKNVKIFFSIFLILSFLGCASNYTARNKKIKTWKDRRDENIVKQKYDFSCGTGSLATLLKYYFEDDVNEKNLVFDYLNTLNKEELDYLVKNGFSILDLKKIAETKGYQTYIVNSTPKLLKLNIPMLVYLEVREYKHFAIYCGTREDRVFLADPSRGNTRMSIHEFLKEWKGKKALILVKKGFKKKLNHNLSIRIEENFRPEISFVRSSLFKQ